jgi:branched-chain amino acid aminotransferase
MNIVIELIEKSKLKQPDFSNIAFGRTFSNRMFTQKWTREEGWYDAKIGPYGPISLDPSTSVFHYAQEIFEGTKAYRRPDGGVNLFRPWENANRFNASAQRMGMPMVDMESHVDAIAQLVRLEQEWVPAAEGGASLYIRPTMIATEPFLGVHTSESFLHFIIVGPTGAYFAGGFKPVSVLISDEYVRAVRGGVGAAKTGGNYAASLLAGAEAAKIGYQQVLWLDAIERRYIEEVGGSNIGFAYGKHIITPALSGSILPGITRKSVIQLAPDAGYTISEERIDINDMLKDIEAGKVTEAFGIGTAAVITPIGRFGYKGKDYTVGNGQPGPVMQGLFKALTDIQYGRVPDPYGWTMKV